MTDQPQTLQEKALAAVAARDAEYAEYAAEQQAAAHQTKIDNLKREIANSPELAGAIIDERTATATIDGLTFTGQSRRGLFLIAYCSYCGEPMSADIQNLIDLGEAIPHLTAPQEPASPFDNWMDGPHRHYARIERRPEPPPLTLTAAERAFVEALRGLLAEADAEAD